MMRQKVRWCIEAFLGGNSSSQGCIDSIKRRVTLNRCRSILDNRKPYCDLQYLALTVHPE
ncbi:hypothetical protein PF010_g29081, partial [Phytophthora fragariae]